MKTVSKLFGIIAFIAVIGFSMVACSTDDDSGDKGSGDKGSGANDLFKGTWIQGDGGTKIVADNGAFNVFNKDENGDWYEIMRGTYSGEGGEITAVITYVNTGLMEWNGEGTKPEDQWTAYADLPEEVRNNQPQSIPITITDGQLTAMDTSFEKEGSGNSGGSNGGGNGSGANDLFKGTWIMEDGGTKIVANNGTFNVFNKDKNGDWYEIMRGTYSGEGNEISAVMTHVNLGLMEWNGEGTKPADLWTAYADLPDEMKDNFSQNVPITITNGQLTANGETFTKQGGSSNSGNSGGNSNGGGNQNQNQNSTFTLTRCPNDFGGKYAIFLVDSEDIMVIGAQSVNNTGTSGTAVQISNGKVSIPMWTMQENGFVRYYGNDTVDGRIMLFDSASVSEGTEPFAERYFSSITFSDGYATRTWEQGSWDNPNGGDPNGGDPGEGEEPIIQLYGTWIEEDSSNTVAFNEDGELKFTTNGQTMKGTFTLDAERIYISLTSQNGEQIQEEIQWQGNYTIEGDELTLELSEKGSSEPATVTKYTKQK